MLKFLIEFTAFKQKRNMCDKNKPCQEIKNKKQTNYGPRKKQSFTLLYRKIVLLFIIIGFLYVII